MAAAGPAFPGLPANPPYAQTRGGPRRARRLPGARRAPSGPHSAQGEGRCLQRLSGAPSKGRGGPRPVSGARLKASRPLHLRPIDLVVFEGPYLVKVGGPISGSASRLDAFSAYRVRARLPCGALGGQQAHRRPVRPGPLVLGTRPLSPPAPAEDRDRTVSRRSEPSSRTALIGEQPNPWDLLQPQDAMSRHRGAKPCRRCGLLGRISLLSPEYLLSVERRPARAGPPDR